MRVQVKRGWLSRHRSGLRGILCSAILFNLAGCGSENLDFDPNVEKADRFGDYEVNLIQKNNIPTLHITSYVDDSFEATVTQLTGGTLEYEMAGGKFRITPEGMITVDSQMDGALLLKFYEHVNVLASTLLNNAAMRALEQNSADEVVQRLDELDEGAMYLSMAQDVQERSFTEWWDSDGELVIKGVGLGLTAGALILSSYYAVAWALGSATGLSGQITWASRMVASSEKDLAMLTKMIQDSIGLAGDTAGVIPFAAQQVAKYTAALVKAKTTLATMATFATGLITTTAGAVIYLGLTSEDGQSDIATCNSSLCEIVDPLSAAMM